MIRTRTMNPNIPIRRSNSIEPEVLRELYDQHGPDFSRIIEGVPDVTIGAIINALNDTTLSDIKEAIIEEIREMAIEDRFVFEDIAERLGLPQVHFLNYRAEIGLDKQFLDEKRAELLIRLKDEHEQHWIKDFEFDVENTRETLDSLLNQKLSNEPDVTLKHLVDLLYAGERIPEDKRIGYKLMAGSIDLIQDTPWAYRLFNELSLSGIGSPLELTLKIQERNDTGHGSRYFVQALEFYGMLPENKAIEYRIFGSASSFYDSSYILKDAPKFNENTEAIRWAYDAKREGSEDNELKDLSLQYIATALAVGGKIDKDKASTIISLAGKSDYALRNEELFREELHQAFDGMDMEEVYNKKDGRLSRYKFMRNLFAGIDTDRFKRSDTNEPLSLISLRASFNMAMDLYGFQSLYSEFKDERLNQLTS
jgi:hypothetical protein